MGRRRNSEVEQEKDQVRERVDLFQLGHTNCAFDTNVAFSWNVFACVTPSLLKRPNFSIQQHKFGMLNGML